MITSRRGLFGLIAGAAAMLTGRKADAKQYRIVVTGSGIAPGTYIDSEVYFSPLPLSTVIDPKVHSIIKQADFPMRVAADIPVPPKASLPAFEPDHKKSQSTGFAIGKPLDRPIGGKSKN